MPLPARPIKLVDSRSEPSASARQTPVTSRTVAHICQEFLPLTHTFIYSLLRHMKKYDPVVFTALPKNLELFPVPRLVTIPPPPRVGRMVNMGVRLIGAFRSTQYSEYAGVLGREHAVLIHAHFGPTGFHSLELSKGLGLPLVTSFYGSDLSRLARQTYWRLAYGRLFSRGNFFLTFSRKMRSMLIDLGCAAEKVESCPAGVDMDELPYRPRRRDGNEEIRILVCNRFVEKKGTEFAVRAFAMLRARTPRCRLVIVGDGPLRSELAGLVERLDLGSCVEFLGMQPRKRVIDELLKAHTFLSPSVRATDGDDEGGINYVVVEAAATGIPLVVTEHSSSEVVRDGISGLIAKERDETDLFAKLAFLVDNSQIWGGMGLEARRAVEAGFVASRRTRRLEEIYTELISRSGARAAMGIPR